MPLCYDQHFTVFQFECDPWDRMSPGAVLRRAQEVSNAQCDELGLDLEAHAKNHTVFLLSRMSFQVISRMPAIAEQVRIQTRAYGTRRAVYHRATSIHAASGQKLCEVDSRWALVDTQTRRILRKPPPEFEGVFGEAPPYEEHDMTMRRPERLVQLADMRASYSLCDRNGHVNNARYADIMCDHLPIELLEKGTPRRMLLFYRAEIPFNHTFALHGGVVPGEGENGYYFLAEDDGTKNFEGYVVF